jgi:hypothetical protein
MKIKLRPTNDDDKSQFLKKLEELGGRAGNKALKDSLHWGRTDIGEYTTYCLPKGSLVAGERSRCGILKQPREVERVRNGEERRKMTG